MRFRYKIAFKEWIRLTSGYEYQGSGVKIMYLTVDAEDSTQGREEARRRLTLMEIDGHIEDVEYIKTSPE